MVKISSLPADASPTSTDYTITVDTETGQTKKVLLSDLIPDGSIGFVDLLSTIFSGQVTTYTNPGSAGGTNSFFYINLKGIKLFWGLTGSVAISGTGFQSTTANVTLPAGFFTTIQSVLTTATSFINTQYITVSVNTSSTSTISLYVVQNNGSNGSASTFVLVIGT